MRHRRPPPDPMQQKKSLGQVFLKVDWPVHRMVERLQDLGVKRAIEIGPGGGVLTKALVEAGIRTTAVEKDPRFAEKLQGYAEELGRTAFGHLSVVQADFLSYDIDGWLAAEEGTAAIVGNIPYHISSPIVLRTLGYLSQLEAVLVMTQLEFAKRVAARPGTKDFGSLTVYSQLRAEVGIEFEVERDCFQPVPKVDSAVLLLQRKSPMLPVEILAGVERVTRQAFTQRRKKLRNSISPFLFGKDESQCPIDLERRADVLSPEEFTALAAWLLDK